MNTRPYPKRSNGRELLGVSQNTRTRTGRKILRPSNQFMRNQQQQEQIKACRVQVKRVNWNFPNEAGRNENSNNKEIPISTICEDETLEGVSKAGKLQEERNSDEFQAPVKNTGCRRCFVKILRLQPDSFANVQNENTLNRFQDENQFQCSETIKPQVNASELVANLYRRCSFRNPALALTRRKVEEKELKKTLPPDDNPLGPVSKYPFRFETNRHSTAYVSDSISQYSNKRADLPKHNQGELHSLPKIKATATSNFKAPKTKDNILLQNKKIKIKQNQQNPRYPKRGKVNKKLSSEADSPKNKDVYDFLSLTQSSDSEAEKHKDPAEDIIKKLIKEGKVYVTKFRNGKPVKTSKGIKRINNKRCPKPGKQKLVKKPLAVQSFRPEHSIIISDDEVENDCPNADDCCSFIEDNVDMSAFAPLDSIPIASHESTTSGSTSKSKPDGVFSSLARSVLMQQTNQNKSENENCLEKPRKWISTPQRHHPEALLHGYCLNLSPIPKISNDDKTIENLIESNTDRSTFIRPPDVPTELSFSSNDSDAENMPPPTIPQGNRIESNDENSSVFNDRRTLNPRRTLSNRSPLKTINIIDVLILPPYKKPEHLNKHNEDNILNNTRQTRYSKANNSQSLMDPNRSALNRESMQCAEKSEALFGFEEYLNDDASDLPEPNNSLISSSSSVNLRSQLKKLKNWCPKNKRCEDSKSSTITRHIFDDDFDKKRGQNDIRNMLCSTMVDLASRKKAENTVAVNSSDSDSSETIMSNDNVDIFGEPESTFRQEDLHRTYERPFKRKRKLQHQYSVFFDSEDESEDEHDLNTSAKKKTKPKHRGDSPNPELENFVSEFNSMIKEAEDYELVVN